jgi:hypothetical protein
MGRKVAALWHATFSIAVGALYFFFVLPRTHELMGDTSHALGTALRSAAAVLIALAALPVALTLLRSRKPEYGTPQLALTLQTWSIVAHVLAGVLIGGTAISEIWLSLDTAGQWLFGIYGAAAAVAVLGIFGFYLSLIAELPPPKPLKTAKEKKTKKEKPRRLRRKRGEKATAQAEDESIEADGAEAEVAETEAPEEEGTGDAEHAETTAEPAAAEAPRGSLRNRRPTGKPSGADRRRSSRRGVTVED